MRPTPSRTRQKRTSSRRLGLVYLGRWVSSTPERQSTRLRRSLGAPDGFVTLGASPSVARSPHAPTRIAMHIAARSVQFGVHQGAFWASTIPLFTAMACTGGENATTAASDGGSTTDGASGDDARASDSALVDQASKDADNGSEVAVGSRCDGRAVLGCNGPGVLCFSDLIDPVACASVAVSCIPAPDGGPLGTGWVRRNADGGNVSGPFVCGYIQV